MSTDTQARAFRRLRWRRTRNHLRALWIAHPLRWITPIATTLGMASLVFSLSWLGFNELRDYRTALANPVIHGLFDVLFGTLWSMLAISTGVIVYAGLFTGPETRFLLTTPAATQQIFRTQFHTAAAFSSFGFLMLGLPVLLAYGLVARVPGWFFMLLPVFLLGFSLLPAALSSIACLLCLRFLPRNRERALVVVGAVCFVAGGWWLTRVGASARQAIVTGSPDLVPTLTAHFALASHPWAPSRWITSGLLAAAGGELVACLRPLVLLWGLGVGAYSLAAWTSTRLYRTAYDRAIGGGRRRLRSRGRCLDRAMEKLVGYLDKPTRCLVIKDFRSFRRDPSQWALLLVFGLLIAFAAGQLRGYDARLLGVLEKPLIGLINLAGTAILLCAGLSRFMFPLISLEGKKFWILGLAPIGRHQILVGKFAFAATCSVLAGLALVLGSELLLGLDPAVVVVHTLTITCLAIGLSGLTVGLGACLADFRESDPSKIVVGPSGTITMVLGLLFLILTLAVMAGPLHLASLIHPEDNPLPPWTFAGVPVGAVLSLVTAWLPLHLGRRALDQAEF